MESTTRLTVYNDPSPHVNRPLIGASLELLIAATQAALTEGARGVLETLVHELAFREGHQTELLRAMIAGYLLAPVAAPPPARIGSRKPTTEELRVLYQTTRDMRGAAFRAECAAMDAADADLGRDHMCQARWPRTPGAAWRVRLSDALCVFVNDKGKVSWRSRVQTVPAPRYWPGRVFPEGLTDEGPADVSKWGYE